MAKWARDNSGILMIMGAILSAVVYTLTTFATVDYVDKKHVQVESTLTIIQDDVKEILKEMPRRRQ